MSSYGVTQTAAGDPEDKVAACSVFFGGAEAKSPYAWRGMCSVCLTETDQCRSQTWATADVGSQSVRGQVPSPPAAGIGTAVFQRG